jgi:hypothetical protein
VEFIREILQWLPYHIHVSLAQIPSTGSRRAFKTLQVVPISGFRLLGTFGAKTFRAADIFNHQICQNISARSSAAKLDHWCSKHRQKNISGGD